ncbi:MAG: hypothetical protein U0X39_16785 [Bacteroidales bacterium]
MSRSVKILVLENEFEATLLSSLLEERNIPHLLRSYHDLVYDGMFQVQNGWGHVEAPEEWKDEILKIYAGMQQPEN